MHAKQNELIWRTAISFDFSSNHVMPNNPVHCVQYSGESRRSRKAYGLDRLGLALPRGFHFASPQAKDPAARPTRLPTDVPPDAPGAIAESKRTGPTKRMGNKSHAAPIIAPPPGWAAPAKVPFDAPMSAERFTLCCKRHRHLGPERARRRNCLPIWPPRNSGVGPRPIRRARRRSLISVRPCLR